MNTFFLKLYLLPWLPLIPAYHCRWLPGNAIPHMKMAYSSSQVAIRQQLTGLIDVATTTWEDIGQRLGLIDMDDDDSDIDM